MSRPYKPYSQRNVQSYKRDEEYLLRLRGAIFTDHELDSKKIPAVCKQIDDLILSLRELGSETKKAG